MRSVTKLLQQGKTLRSFSTKNILRHSPIIVIGAGTGGVSVSSQIARQGLVKAKDITIFDPMKTHYYQTGFTIYGGGILKNMKKIKYDMNEITKDFNFQGEGIIQINPESNTIETSNNEKWTYDQLIVAPGLIPKYEAIPGLKELLDDKTKFVGTVYSADYVEKVAWMRENFKGGRALFTQPPPPLKCGGAPQKMAYLCEDYWRRNGIKADIHFMTPLPQMLGVKYYSDVLYEIATSRGIKPHFNTVLISVRDGVATFKNNETNEVTEEKYDFLHVVPHLATPPFLQGSPLSNPAGLLTVDATMRHKKYPNIWGIGDCIDLPNAKTAAALYSQAPVLVHNLECSLKNLSYPVAKYDGYSACPIFLKKGSVLLAEFKDYLDDEGKPVNEIDESFNPGQQKTPSLLYYYVGLYFTYIYRLALKGRWFGKNSFSKPNYKKAMQADIRKYYKLILVLPYFAGSLLLISSILNFI